MFSEKQLTSSVPLVVDVSGRGISDVTQIPGGGREVAALTADNNRLVSLSGVQTFASLVQLSVCSNNLVDISRVSTLTSLVTLNLQNNSITVIEGLESLTQLEWLGLAGNSIKVMSGLSWNTKLAHVDLSDNCISELGNISMLQNLKTLLLHGNAVKLLKSIPKCFPPSLSALSLAENHVQDLNEISFLSALPELAEVSVMGNPCVSLTHHSMLFDYRPYVMYWCLGLSSLDGTPITAEEKLRAVSLFRSDHAYPFQLGQHQPLVQYLTTACPLPILQNQLISELSEKSPSLSSTHSLLSQAMSLQNPRQKAEVLQKLRVLQVIEQMISEQESLLNPHQPEQQNQPFRKPPPQPHTHTTSQKPFGEEVSDKILPQGKEGVSAHSSLTDTSTLTADLETMEEEYIIRPQPSQAFEALDGASWSMKSSLRAVRMAWAGEGGGTGGNQNTRSLSSSGEVNEGRDGGKEVGEGGRGRGKEEGGRVEGEVGRGRGGEEGGRVEGEAREGESGREERGRENTEEGERGEREILVEGEGCDEPDFDVPTSPSSIQRSNAETLTPLPSLETTTTVDSCTGSLGNEDLGIETRNVALESAAIQPGMEHNSLLEPQPITPGGKYDESCTKSYSNGSLDLNFAGTNALTRPTTITSSFVPASSVDTTPPTVPAVTSWERMRREFSDIPLHTSSSAELSTQSFTTTAENDTDAAVGSLTATQSTAESSCDASALTTAQYSVQSNSTDATLGTLTAAQNLPKSSSDIVNSLVSKHLAESNSDATTQGPAQYLLTATQVSAESSSDATIVDASDPSLERTAEGSLLEVKYLSSVYQPTCHLTSERWGGPGLIVTGGSGDVSESGTRFQDVLGDGNETRLAQEWDLSSSSLSHQNDDGEKKEDGKEGEGGFNEGESEARLSQRYWEAKVEQRIPQNSGKASNSSAGIYQYSEPQTVSTTSTEAGTCLSINGEGMTDVRGPPVSRGEGTMGRREAAVSIQAWVRGVICRRRVSQYRIRRQAAITIQSTWRGYRSRCRDPVVVGAMRELSHKKMEGYVAAMFLQLKGCREEMAHQAQVIQLQEETLSSLIQEVERLSSWKRQVEGDTLNRAASTIQRHWRQHQTTRQDSQRDVESLLVACSELRRQVRDLEQKVELLQEDRNKKYNTNDSVMSLPAPVKLGMSKHTADTILLRWKAADGGSSTLLGYRVYVNGMEEGMVGPTKHKAYIEGLDTSSTYRVSVRAVYECGESEDSNTLLVAAVSPKPGDPPTDELTLEGSRKEILSLPRSSGPPEPTELPVLVEKTSALSKSESCSTLEAVSLEVSAVHDAHSVSLDLPSSSSLTGRDRMSTDQMGTSVDPSDQTSIHHQTSTNVDVGSYLVDSTDRNPHHIDTMYKETSADLNSRALPEDPDHPLSSRLPSRQEVVHELSVRYPPTGPTTTATHTEHDRNYVSAPSALHEQPTTKTGPNRPEHSKHQQRQDPGNDNDGSSVCGKELASPVGVEAKDVLTGDRLCGQTQAVATSVNDEGVLQTDTPPLAIDKPSPSLDTVGGRKVTHRDKLTSMITSPENKRKRTPSPVNPRSHRLAANFDANLSGGHPRNTTVGISSASQPPKQLGHLHQSHATELPACHPPTLQSNPSPTVSPTRRPQPDKCGHSVGQTPIPASSERHSEKIIFSGEEQCATYEQPPITNCQKEGWGTSCQKEHRGMTHAGIFGEGFQQPLRKSGDVGHLSWRQPTTRQGLDKHATSSELESHKADTGCLVGPPPTNSDLVAPTP